MQSQRNLIQPRYREAIRELNRRHQVWREGKGKEPSPYPAYVIGSPQSGKSVVGSLFAEWVTGCLREEDRELGGGLVLRWPDVVRTIDAGIIGNGEEAQGRADLLRATLKRRAAIVIDDIGEKIILAPPLTRQDCWKALRKRAASSRSGMAQAMAEKPPGLAEVETAAAQAVLSGRDRGAMGVGPLVLILQGLPLEMMEKGLIPEPFVPLLERAFEIDGRHLPPWREFFQGLKGGPAYEEDGKDRERKDLA